MKKFFYLFVFCAMFFAAGQAISGQTVTVELYVSPEGRGSVAGGGEVTTGTSVTVTATPNPGWEFVNWTSGRGDGTVVSSNASHTLVVNSNTVLTANFRLAANTVVFEVVDGHSPTQALLSGARIVFNGVQLPPDNVARNVTADTYTYYVIRDGYKTERGSVTVVSESLIETVTIHHVGYVADIRYGLDVTYVDDNKYNVRIEFVDCGKNEILVTVEAPGFNTVVDINNIRGVRRDGNLYDMTLTNLLGGNNVYLLTVDGIQHDLVINKPMVFNEMVETRWGYRHTVINNPVNNGGLLFEEGSYLWYSDSSTTPESGQTGQSIEATTPGGTISTVYRVEAMSNRGLVRSCRLPASSAAIVAAKAYPNPVASGQSVFIEASISEEMFEGAVVEVYDNFARLLHSQPLTSTLTELHGNYIPGAYIIVLRGSNFRNELKLIVD